MSSDNRLSKTVAEIEIEDPMDFLTVAEKEEYIRRRPVYAKKEPVPGADKGLALAVRLGALIIALLLTYIVWLLFLRPVVYSVFGWNEWEAVQEEESADEHYVVTTSQLNLRNGPSTATGEIVVTVPEGTRLTQIAEADGWSTVLYEGQTLYCSSEYLKAAE